MAGKVTIGSLSFEEMKQTNEHGAEYWSARAIQTLLGYTQWRRFEKAIERAISSCKESGNPPENHFAGAGKMVGLGSGSVRDLADYHLSRFVCYLIAQNGDPRKLEIARAQQYFAIQTRSDCRFEYNSSHVHTINTWGGCGEVNDNTWFTNEDRKMIACNAFFQVGGRQ